MGLASRYRSLRASGSYYSYLSLHINAYFTVVNFTSHFVSLIDISLGFRYFTGMSVNLMSIKAMLMK